MSRGGSRPGDGSDLKYARIERERRFLLAGVPAEVDLESSFREIRDLYIEGTHLRLRQIRAPDGSPIRYKLTQKIATESPHACRITSMYIDEPEFRLLSRLPGRTLRKRRVSFRCGDTVCGIDRFLGPLDGLVLAEIEGRSEAELKAVPAPPFAGCDVTRDVAFTGGALAHAEPARVLERARRLLRDAGRSDGKSRAR